MFNLKLIYKSYLLIGAILLLSACNGVTSSDDSVVKGTSSFFEDLSLNEKETLNYIGTNQEAILKAINQERSQSRSCGDRGTFPPTHPLTWNPLLYKAAREHITDLAYSNTFAHDGSGTQYDITGNGRPSKFYERIVANGYTNYYSVGENIAGGQRNLEEVMKAWMASPGHCANIMKNTYTEIGVAVLVKNDSTYQVYWGQNFGSKRR